MTLRQRFWLTLARYHMRGFKYACRHLTAAIVDSKFP